MSISKKVTDRITAQLKKYQIILAEAKRRDISESDTVVIVADMLADVLGYKKYVEITTEFAIRGTFVDLAVKVGEDVRFLVEAKAIGVDLKDGHVKQAIDYGANQGIEWVILTSGASWRIYKIHFGQPIEKSLVFDLNMLDANPRNPQLLECLGALSREGFTKPSMTALFHQQQAMSKFSLAATLLSSPVLQALRRELRRVSPSLKIDEDFLRTILQAEVLKREVVDSDEARQALQLLRRANKAIARVKARTTEAKDEAAGLVTSVVVPAEDATAHDRDGS